MRKASPKKDLKEQRESGISDTRASTAPRASGPELLGAPIKAALERSQEPPSQDSQAERVAAVKRENSHEADPEAKRAKTSLAGH